MDDKDMLDEIIDLEDDEPIEESLDNSLGEESLSDIQESSVSPKNPNITKRGSKDKVNLARNMLANSDKSTPHKLQNLNNKNRSFPPLGGSSFSNNEEKEDTLKDKVQDKVAAKGITAATGGAINGKNAEKLAELARKSGALDNLNPLKKYKWFLIGGGILVLFIIFIVIFIVVVSSDNKEFNENSTNYVHSELSEDDLIYQLKFYGFCTNAKECKKTGIYKYVNKLKELNDDYSEECSINVDIDKPCGVEINTSLILETLNYYQNVFESYDSNKSDVDENSNNSFFGKLFSKIKQNRRINQMLDDAEDLAKAQVEYVEETCKMSEDDKEEVTLKYHQISFDKYVSYLAYGKSSTHPNYQDKPVEIENDICVGPTNDFISTEYQKQNEGYQTDEHGNITQIAGSGKGVDIVNYALQFVGNPYVWGGNSLTNGIDCSGFTKAIYGHFGIDLPRKSSEQINANGGTVIGRSLSDINKAQPGDLLVWDGHVAIYMGDNKMVHAQSKKTGIVVSGVSSGHPFKGIVRF